MLREGTFLFSAPLVTESIEGKREYVVTVLPSAQPTQGTWKLFPLFAVSLAHGVGDGHLKTHIDR
jgi:hypothetical protein